MRFQLLSRRVGEHGPFPISEPRVYAPPVGLYLPPTARLSRFNNLKILYGPIPADATIAQYGSTPYARDYGRRESVMWWRGKALPLSMHALKFSERGEASGRFVLNVADSTLSADGGEVTGGFSASQLRPLFVSPDGIIKAGPADHTPVYVHEGVRVLGKHRAARDWLFLGWARTNGSTEFVDNTTDRLVVNWYNKVKKNLLARPGYVDNNADNSYTTTGNWGAANAGTGSRVTYISDGVNAVVLRAVCLATASSAATAAGIGVGVDSTTNPSKGGWVANTTTFGQGCVSHSEISAEGYHTADLLIASFDAVNTVTYYADTGRHGATADVPMTYLDGEVWA